MLVLKAHDRPVQSLAFSPDGQLLATTNGYGSARLWSLAGPAQVREWARPRWALGVAYAPDGRHLALTGDGVRLVPTAGGGAKVLTRGWHPAVAFSPDGTVLAAHGGASGFRRWAVPSGDRLPDGWGGTRASTRDRQFPFGGLAFSPDGRLVATAFAVQGKQGYDSWIHLWDARTGALCQSLAAEYAYDHPRAIRFSPDGRLLAGTYGPVLRVWDVNAGTVAAVRKPGTRHLLDLAFTPDGRRLVTVSNDRVVRLWDTGTWAEAGGYEWKVGKLRSVAVSPDGLRLAAGGDTGKVVIWDADA